MKKLLIFTVVCFLMSCGGVKKPKDYKPVLYRTMNRYLGT